MNEKETSLLVFGPVPFKTAARLDRESGTGIVEIEVENNNKVSIIFSDTNAALALTEAMLHLSREMIKHDTSSNSKHQVGQYCIVGDDTAELVKSVLSGNPSYSY